MLVAFLSKVKFSWAYYFKAIFGLFWSLKYTLHRTNFHNEIVDIYFNDFLDEGEADTKKNEDVHVPAISLTEKKKTDKLKEKLALQKERRAIQSKLRLEGFPLF